MRSRPSIPVGLRSDDGRCSLNSSHSDIDSTACPRRTSRKHHCETRALTESTVNGHGAAHRDADVPHNPEPDAETATTLLAPPLEALEDLRLLIRRNADAMVANRNPGEI